MSEKIIESLRRFLYFLRGLLACEYIEAQKTHPPVAFEKLVDATITDQSISGLNCNSMNPIC